MQVEKVTFGFSKWKSGMALFFFLFSAINPIWMHFSLPGLFDFSTKAPAESAILIGSFGFLSIAGGVLAYLLIGKLRSKSAGLALSSEGIRSNVSGVGEKFVPWNEVQKAAVVSGGKQTTFIHVLGKESGDASTKKSFFSLPQGSTRLMIIWPAVLVGSANKINDAINEYLEATIIAQTSEKEASHSLAEYVNKAA